MWRRAPLVLLGLVAAAPAAAQQGACNLVDDPQAQVDIDRRTDLGLPMVYISGRFLVRCEGGAELRADQGTLNELARELTLVGNVHFQDPQQTLTAQHAIYNSVTGRLYATGNVVFTNRQEGSTIRGPELEYFRPMPGRPEAQIMARQRPHLVLRPRSGTSTADPLDLDADQVMIYGQNLSATGNVVITRPDLRATAAEAQYNEAQGGLELRGGSRIESERFQLAGQVIQARMRDGVLEHIHSRTDARLTGEDLTVAAPEVQLFFADSVLQRAVARTGALPAAEGEGEGAQSRPRAVATSRNFRLTADSLDAVLPGQQLEQVVAIGRARGEAIDTTGVDTAAVLARADTTAADSALVAALGMIDRDWIVGDTVIGFFAPRDSAAPGEPGDTAVVLQRLVARGAAQSLYRVEPQVPRTDGRRGINYLSGDTIELEFAQGELDTAQVAGLRRGLYLDPAAPGPAGPPPPRPAGVRPEPGSTTQPGER